MGGEFTGCAFTSGDSFAVISNQQPALHILQKLTTDRGREKKVREQFILIISFLKISQKIEVHHWKQWTLEKTIFYKNISLFFFFF